MSATPEPEQGDADVFLDVEAIGARYGIGRNKAYELVAVPGFPASAVPGMWRVPLVALRAYELAVSLADTCAAPDAALVPVFVSPPPARAAGRPRRVAS